MEVGDQKSEVSLPRRSRGGQRSEVRRAIKSVPIRFHRLLACPISEPRFTILLNLAEKYDKLTHHRVLLT